jgi:hypothetical protein
MHKETQLLGEKILCSIHSFPLPSDAQNDNISSTKYGTEILILKISIVLLKEMMVGLSNKIDMRRTGVANQQQTSANTHEKSLDDAIAKMKAALQAKENHRVRQQHKTIFQSDLSISHHPHAKLVQRASIALLVGGILTIIALPQTFFTHMVAFAAMFSLIFIGVPNLLLQSTGVVAWNKVMGWSLILLFFGAMTTIAMGPTGSLWSWAPWLQQFSR